jgi:hypothetical protein
LEGYKPPKQLDVPQRYLDVFRDNEARQLDQPRHGRRVIGRALLSVLRLWLYARGEQLVDMALDCRVAENTRGKAQPVAFSAPLSTGCGARGTSLSCRERWALHR